MKPVFFTLLLTAEDYMLPCLNKRLFGIECPGCGIQRAAKLVLQGEFAAAFQMYPGIYPIFLLLSFLVVNLFIKFKYAFQIKVALLILVVATIMISYIHKMSHIFH